ncbi:MAG: DUF4286 family protein [Bacteroidetes bacterium]|nr:DUF4286 family protein [Bacteroidota bacterium]
MIIYNVTTKVTPAIQAAWLQWMKEEHIPEIIATGCFTAATIAQLLEVDDSDGSTYTVQYMAESKALYNVYIEMFATAMRNKVFEKWGDQFIAFRSLMQVIH